MIDIIALLACFDQSVDKTTVKQLNRIIVAMLTMTGRVTMLGISRWTEKGGSNRTPHHPSANGWPSIRIVTTGHSVVTNSRQILLTSFYADDFSKHLPFNTVELDRLCNSQISHKIIDANG